jgi:thiol-disulfide isomerase/thioredoxin
MKFNKLIILILWFAGVLNISAAVGPKILSWSKLSSFHLIDKNGKNTNLVSGKLTVLLLLSPECPLCQNYAPTTAKLQLKYPGVAFYGIIPGAAYTVKEVEEFSRKFKINFPVLIDKSKMLTKYIQGTTTPEVIVINRIGTVTYRGLIDNWAVSLGQKRQVISENYLDQALQELSTKKTTLYKETKPVGCLINDL